MVTIVETNAPTPAGMRRLLRSQVVPLPVGEAFAFFGDPLNLEAITPPWLRFRLLTPAVGLGSGALIEYRPRVHGVAVPWRTPNEGGGPGVRLVDRQPSGPFAHWKHLHTFAPVDGGTLIADRVDYRLPLGPLGAVAHSVLVRRDLDRIFDYRREAVARL